MQRVPISEENANESPFFSSEATTLLDVSKRPQIDLQIQVAVRTQKGNVRCHQAPPNYAHKSGREKAETHLAETQMHRGRFRNVHDFAIRSHHKDEAVQCLQEM